MRLSAEDSATLLVLEEERERLSPPVTRFVDCTAQIVQSYSIRRAIANDTDNGEQNLYEPTVPHEPLQLLEVHKTLENSSAAPSVSTCCGATGIGFDSIAASPLHERTYHAYDLRSPSQGTDQRTLFPGATSHPSDDQDANVAFLSSEYYDAGLPGSMLEQIQLVRAFVEDTGTWCEISDVHRHFTVSYIHKLMENKPFVAAAMALASRQLDVMNRRQQESTLKLYQHAVQSLLNYEPSQCGEATLVCCILLSFYEMISSDGSEWRRHLKGCLFNLENKGWNGSSPALVGASFWVFARIDMWAAYLNKTTTLLPTDSWVMPEERGSSTRNETSDGYCNLATLLLAKIINSLADGCGDNAHDLWNNLQSWYNGRPSQFLPIRKIEAGRGNSFPVILLAGSSPICGNTFYHTGCILLLRTGRVPSTGDSRIHEPLWHAKQICGISASHTSHACWINQVYPLCLAGEVLQGMPGLEDVEEHPAEKFAILKLLARIEKEAGWPTAGKASDLRKLWGLE